MEEDEGTLSPEQRSHLEEIIREQDPCSGCAHMFPSCSTTMCCLMHNISSPAYIKALVELDAGVIRNPAPEAQSLLLSTLLFTECTDRIKAVRVLIKHGANLNAASQGGNTLMNLAVGLASDELVRLLAKHGVRYMNGGSCLISPRLHDLYCALTALEALCIPQRRHPCWLPTDCRRLIRACLIDPHARFHGMYLVQE